MVVLEGEKIFNVETALMCKSESLQASAERIDKSNEERRKTGRYLAAGIVIFLLVLGLYHAVLSGSQRLSALLGAALVMLFYLLWVLYASQRKKRLNKINEQVVQRDLEEVITSARQSKENLNKTSKENLQEKPKENQQQSVQQLTTSNNCSNPPTVVCRSYSIA